METPELIRNVYWQIRGMGEYPSIAFKWACIIADEKERQDFIDDVRADLDRIEMLTLDGAI